MKQPYIVKYTFSDRSLIFYNKKKTWLMDVPFTGLESLIILDPVCTAQNLEPGVALFIEGVRCLNDYELNRDGHLSIWGREKHP